MSLCLVLLLDGDAFMAHTERLTGFDELTALRRQFKLRTGTSYGSQNLAAVRSRGMIHVARALLCNGRRA